VPPSMIASFLIIPLPLVVVPAQKPASTRAVPAGPRL
jgi:hypothetical protein